MTLRNSDMSCVQVKVLRDAEPPSRLVTGRSDLPCSALNRIYSTYTAITLVNAPLLTTNLTTSSLSFSFSHATGRQ